MLVNGINNIRDDYYFNYGGEMVTNQSEYYIYNEEIEKGEYYSFDEEGRCTGKVR